MKHNVSVKNFVFFILFLFFTTSVFSQVSQERKEHKKADLIVMNAKITTLDSAVTSATTVAIKDGKFIAVGSGDILRRHRGQRTRVINARGSRLIPGIIDAHMHVTSYGATFNREIRWDNLTSLESGLQMIKEQAARTPQGEWVRVLGGWTPAQFTERRIPTPSDLDEVSPDVPVMVTHLWDRVILNKAGLAALNITRDTPDPAGGYIERDSNGEPTGVMVSVSDWAVILGAMGQLPRPASQEEIISSTKQYVWQLNSYGVTSVLDGGAGAYPQNYQGIMSMAQNNQLNLRVAGTLYPPIGVNENQQFNTWLDTVPINTTDPFFRIFGAGEILSYAGFDLTNFQQERPDLPNLESAMRPILSSLIQRGWSFNLHAAYDETITRLLNVIEEVNASTPISTRWWIDHAETLSVNNMERIKRLGGGVNFQGRLYFQGEQFLQQYGSSTTLQMITPVKEMVRRGVPVGLGTDALRIASSNPWITAYYLISGKAAGGIQVLPADERLTREEALKLYTLGSAWFSGDEDKKGSISVGKFADFTLLSEDYFTIPEERIKAIRSLLTVVDGRVVYANGPYGNMAAAPNVLPEWSYYNRNKTAAITNFTANKNQNTVELRWKASGENLKRFILERSDDNGQSFIRIGTIAANNQSGESNYRFTDGRGHSHRISYRLQAVNANGIAEDEKTINVDASSLHVTVSQNPVINNLLLLSIENTMAQALRVQVSSLLGREYINRSFTVDADKQVSVDVSRLPKGIYLATVSDNTGRRTVKFINK